jgi:hypothetical protein
MSERSRKSEPNTEAGLANFVVLIAADEPREPVAGPQGAMEDIWGTCLMSLKAPGPSRFSRKMNATAQSSTGQDHEETANAR